MPIGIVFLRLIQKEYRYCTTTRQQGWKIGSGKPTSGEIVHKLKFDYPKNKNKPELEGLSTGEALSY